MKIHSLILTTGLLFALNACTPKIKVYSEEERISYLNKTAERLGDEYCNCVANISDEDGEENCYQALNDSTTNVLVSMPPHDLTKNRDEQDSQNFESFKELLSKYLEETCM